MQAILALEDGRVFRGKGYGAKGECYGEVVFNTSITGYQEIFTDPSYAGQVITFTYPHIGNYGVSAQAMESERPWARAAIMREAVNREDAPGAEASLRMDLTRPDAAPELELNEILWRSVRGASAVMPPPTIRCRVAISAPPPGSAPSARERNPRASRPSPSRRR